MRQKIVIVMIQFLFLSVTAVFAQHQCCAGGGNNAGPAGMANPQSPGEVSGVSNSVLEGGKSACGLSADTTDWFSRTNSSTFNAVYWTDVKVLGFNIGAGIWGSYRMPAKQTITETSRNYLIMDSLLLLWGLPLPVDSMTTLKTEPFASVKLSLFPSRHIAGPFYGGLRLDYIDYLTPNAHTDAQEPIRDQTLRPVLLPATGNYTVDICGSSKWEREAVNVFILTPQVTLNVGGVGGFGVAYAYAIYAKPVDRQGRISDRQSNIILSAFVNYQFKSKE